MKKGMIAAAAIALMGGATLGISSTFAASAENEGKPFGKLIEAIATRFNVSTEEVEAVFNEHKEEMMENREAMHEERLAKAVEEGKLTQEQADAIQAHHEEMKTFMDSLKDMSEEERKAAMEQHREENKNWAENLNLPEDFTEMRRGGEHRGMGNFKEMNRE